MRRQSSPCLSRGLYGQLPPMPSPPAACQFGPCALPAPAVSDPLLCAAGTRMVELGTHAAAPCPAWPEPCSATLVPRLTGMVLPPPPPFVALPARCGKRRRVVQVPASPSDDCGVRDLCSSPRSPWEVPSSLLEAMEPSPPFCGGVWSPGSAVTEALLQAEDRDQQLDLAASPTRPASGPPCTPTSELGVPSPHWSPDGSPEDAPASRSYGLQLRIGCPILGAAAS